MWRTWYMDLYNCHAEYSCVWYIMLKGCQSNHSYHNSSFSLYHISRILSEYLLPSSSYCHHGSSSCEYVKWWLLNLTMPIVFIVVFTFHHNQSNKIALPPTWNENHKTMFRAEKNVVFLCGVELTNVFKTLN